MSDVRNIQGAYAPLSLASVKVQAASYSTLVPIPAPPEPTVVSLVQTSLALQDDGVFPVDVQQDAAVNTDVRVALSTFGGNAIQGIHYDWWTTSSSSTGQATTEPVASIATGELQASAYLRVYPSAGASGARTFNVRIDSATADDRSFNPTIGTPSQILATIPDSSVAEPDIAFQAGASAVDESNLAHAVTVLLSIPAPTGLTFTVQVLGTAVHGTDYTLDAGAPDGSDQITIAVLAGATSFDIDLDTILRAGYQGDRAIDFTLIDGSGYNLGTQTTHSTRIAETAQPEPTVEFQGSAALVILEGQSTFIPILGTSPLETVEHTGAVINYAIVSNTIAEDTFSLDPLSPVILPAGAPNTNLELVVGSVDAADDGKSFVIELLPGAGYALGANTQRTVTIQDVVVPVTPVVGFASAGDTFEQSDAPGASLTIPVRREDGQGMGLSAGALTVLVTESATTNAEYTTTYPGGTPGQLTWNDGDEYASIVLSAPINGIPAVVTLTLVDDTGHDLGTNSTFEVAIDVPVTNQPTVLDFEPIPGVGTGQQLVSYCFPIDPTEENALPVYHMGPRACDVFPMGYVPGTTKVDFVQAVAPVGAPTGSVDFGITGTGVLPPTSRWEDVDLQNLRLVMDGCDSAVVTDTIAGRMTCQLVEPGAANLKKRYRNGIWVTDEVYWSQFEAGTGEVALSVTTIATRRADRSLVDLHITIANDCYDPTLASTAQDDVVDGDFLFEKIVLNHQGLDTNWHFAVPLSHQIDACMAGTTTAEVVIVKQETPVATQLLPGGAMLHRRVGFYHDTSAGGQTLRLGTEKALEDYGLATAYAGPLAQNARRGWGPEKLQLPSLAGWEYERPSLLDWSNAAFFGTEGNATFTGRDGAIRMAEDMYGKRLQAIGFEANQAAWPDSYHAEFQTERKGWYMPLGEADPNVGGGTQFSYAWGLINHRFEVLSERIGLMYASQRQASHVTNINTGLPLTEAEMVAGGELVWGGSMVDKHVQSRWPAYVDANADSAEPAPAGWAQKPSGPNADKPWQVAPGALPTTVQTKSDVQPMWDLDRYSPFPGTHFMRYARAFMPLLWSANCPWARWMLEHEMAQIERSFPSTAVDTKPASDQGLYQFQSFAPVDSIAKIEAADGGVQTQVGSGFGGCVASNSGYNARMYRGTAGPMVLAAHAIRLEPTGARRTELLNWAKVWARWCDYVLSPLGIGDRFWSNDSSEYNFPDDVSVYGAHDFAGGTGALTDQWLVQKSWFTALSAYAAYCLESAAAPRPTLGPTSGVGNVPVNALERHYRQAIYNLGVASGSKAPGAFQFVVSPATAGAADAVLSSTPGDNTFLPWDFGTVADPYIGVADDRTVWHLVSAIHACLDEKVDAGAYTVWLARIVGEADATITDSSTLSEILAAVKTLGRAYANGSNGLWELNAAYPYMVVIGLLEHMILHADYGPNYVGTLPDAPAPPATRHQPNVIYLTTFAEGANPDVVYDEIGSLNMSIIKPDAVAMDDAREWGSDGNGTYLDVKSALRVTSASTQNALIQQIKAAGKLTLEFWGDPADLTQDDPARIFAISPPNIGGSNTNASLMLNRTNGSHQGAGSFRLRTSEHPTGVEDLWTTASDIYDLDAPWHFMVVYEVGVAPVLYMNKLGEAFVGGRPLPTGGTLPTGNLEDWIEDAHFTIFNEQDGGVNQSVFLTRAFTGKGRLMAVHADALTPSEVALNHALGPDGSGTAPLPSVSFTSTSSSMGEWETGQVVSLTIAPAQQGPLTVGLTLDGSTRVSLDPVSAVASANVVIPAGASTFDIPVYPTQTAAADGDAAVSLTIDADAAYSIGTGTHALTILDDDTQPVEAGFVSASSNVLDGDIADVELRVEREYDQDIDFTISRDAASTMPAASASTWNFVGEPVTNSSMVVTLPAHTRVVTFQVQTQDQASDLDLLLNSSPTIP